MPDPLWEQYYAWSPYAYAAGNPVSLLDRDGLDVTLSVNDRKVASIVTDDFDFQYNYSDGNITILEDFEMVEFNLDQFLDIVGDGLESSDIASIGFQANLEFTYAGGCDISYQFMNFTKGKDKDNGWFSYVSPSGRIGYSMGVAFQALVGFSDMSNIDKHTPEGAFLDYNISAGPFTIGKSVGIPNKFSIDLLNPLSANLKYFNIYTIGIGLGKSAGFSVGLGETKLLED